MIWAAARILFTKQAGIEQATAFLLVAFVFLFALDNGSRFSTIGSRRCIRFQRDLYEK